MRGKPFQPGQVANHAFHKLCRLFNAQHDPQRIATAFLPLGIKIFDQGLIEPSARALGRGQGLLGTNDYLVTT